MQTLEYRTVDKSSWAQGPWHHEPDKVQWQDETTGMPCLIVRGPSGALCGYVGVDESHPLFNKEYHKPNVSVHGGLTYADLCQPNEDESEGICHLPDADEPDHVWWFGFDCAHAGDVCPKYDRPYETSYSSYKNIDYVRNEVTSLAAQLKEIANG